MKNKNEESMSLLYKTPQSEKKLKLVHYIVKEKEAKR